MKYHVTFYILEMFVKLTRNQYANVWIKRFTLEFSHILTMIATTEYSLANFYKWTFFYSADWVGNVKITVRPQMSLVQNSKYSCIFLYLTVFTSLSLSLSFFLMLRYEGIKIAAANINTLNDRKFLSSR